MEFHLDFTWISLLLSLCFGLTFGCWLFSSRVEAVEVGVYVEAKSLSVLGSGISLGSVPTVGVGAEELYIAVRIGAIVEVDSKTTQYLHDSI